ncbi:hypothetical protein [Weissella cibaria]|uniref:hypothetical protein n=1 Tax=Weissella cibaria TaxID=137591 RepID=UPI001FF4D475|nr:hypothetical protein [Weissella cibaria]UOX37814.1 hypothetical protein IDM39_06025 [Weissella cibaria]
MSDFKGLMMGMLIAAVIYLADRYLLKWFGAVPSVLFVVLVGYLVIFHHTSFFSALTLLLVGESILNGIWLSSLDARKKKVQQELERMKTKDLS